MIKLTIKLAQNYNNILIIENYFILNILNIRWIIIIKIYCFLMILTIQI